MSRTQTADEVLAMHQAAMPGPLGEIFNRLWNEVGTLHDTWGKFDALYVASQETVDLLNATAGSFFYDLSGILGDNILLHICRLTDSATQFGNSNLSIQQLPANIPDAAFSAQVLPLVNNAVARTAFARTWRNKRLAHKDMATRNGDLPPATIGAFKDALAALRDVMNAVEKHYMKSTTAYLWQAGGSDGVGGLIDYLKLGRDVHDAEMANWQSKRQEGPR